MALLRRHGGHEADMDHDMNGVDSHAASGPEPLSADGVDFSNRTQALNFLDDLIGDTYLRADGAQYARYFWYGVVAFLAVATLFTLLRWMNLQSRLREAARRRDSPAKPRRAPVTWLATITAMGREATYLQVTPASHPWLKVPPVGTLLLILGYLAFILALEFSNNSIEGAQYWQGLGVRAGWLAVAQTPLLILLVNKNSIIGTLSGTSWERLNVLHRWSSRMMLLLAIFHFAFQSTGWQQYGVMSLEWQIDDCPTTGIAAFAILLWMNISTIAPIRRASYEFFVVQHIVTFFGFIVAIMLHLPSTALSSRVYIYIPIGLYLADRLLRTLLLAWNNLRVSRAYMVQLNGGVTKLRVTNKAIRNWRPGSHMMLSIPKFGVMQSHPATILSTPKSHHGDLVFMLKSHKGFTNEIFLGANTSTEALVSESKEATDLEQNAQITQANHIAILDGPYGGSQADFAAFDSVALISGSTGVTFNLSILQDLADRAASQGKRLPVRNIHFVWCVKDSKWARWASEEIATACEKLSKWSIDTTVSIYVTCADVFTEQSAIETKDCGCECDKSKGPCCCVVVDEDEKGEDVILPVKGSAVANESSEEASDSSTRLLETEGRAGVRLPFLRCATFYSGRPDVHEVVATLLDGAHGESGISVCGPTGLCKTVRNTVVRESDSRAIHKGTGSQGVYLHVEAFS